MAVFDEANKPCIKCGNMNVQYQCQSCDACCCGACIFELDADHDPTHVLQLRPENNCMTSRLRGDDSSMSMDRAGSSFLYDPCKKCSATLFDVDPVYRCDICPDFIICEACFDKYPQVHEHPLSRFQRKVLDVKETKKKTKTRDSDGNRVINDYIVVKELGRGAYAKVKLLQHVRTRQLFAVKILKRLGAHARRNNISLHHDEGQDLLREIAVMKVMDHANLVKLVEVIDDEESEKVYVIMEFCKNGCLHKLGQPPLPLDKVRQYGFDILKGLEHLHSNFLFHRDIKPENVLIDEEGVAKLADFGTCDTRLRKAETDGTPAYHSPEMLRGESPSGLVLDSWAFGVAMYQAAFGSLPFPTTSHVELIKSVLSPDPVPIPENADADLEQILLQLLQKNLEGRAMVQDAARHRFFRRRERGIALQTIPSDPIPTESPLAVETTEELYSRAMTFVRKGRQVHESFHGLEGVKRARQFSLAHALTLADSDKLVNSGSAEGSAVESTPSIEVTSTPPAAEKRGSQSLSRSGKMRPDEIVKALVDSRSTNAKLALENIAMKELFPVVEQAVDIEHLMVRSNGLSSVAHVNFARFSRLREVAIVSNSLAEFPVEILAARTIQRIDLSGNFITTVPAELADHPLLERLSLNGNRIAYIPDAKPFAGKHFRHVRLSNNLIDTFPKDLDQCISLEMVLDDVPALVDEWTNNLIYKLKNVSVVWNDLFPTKIVSSLPLFLATRRISLYTQCVIQVLNIKHVCVSQHASDDYSPREKTDFLTVAVSPNKARASRKSSTAKPPLLSHRQITSNFVVTAGSNGEQLCAFLEGCVATVPEAGSWLGDVQQASIVVCLNEEEATSAEMKEMLQGIAMFVRKKAPPTPNMTAAEAVDFVARACRGFYS